MAREQGGVDPRLGFVRPELLLDFSALHHDMLLRCLRRKEAIIVPIPAEWVYYLII
jgi:hypothetical protein